MNVGEVATPEALVVAVAVVPPPAKVPLAPDVGAENVTSTPASGLPVKAVKVAVRGAAKAVLIGALCDDPLVAVMTAEDHLPTTGTSPEIPPKAKARSCPGPVPSNW